MFESCLEKQKKLKDLFVGLERDAQYQKIIELGQNLRKMNEADKVDENRVYGCQSRMYVKVRMDDDKLFFEASSDALISAGLAALLLSIYNEETPETVLKCPPTVLKELAIPSLLSPSRSNGLAALFTRMQQEAIKHLQFLAK